MKDFLEAIDFQQLIFPADRLDGFFNERLRVGGLRLRQADC